MMVAIKENTSWVKEASKRQRKTTEEIDEFIPVDGTSISGNSCDGIGGNRFTNSILPLKVMFSVKQEINKLRKTTQEIDGFIPIDDGCEEFEFVRGESDGTAIRPKINKKKKTTQEIDEFIPIVDDGSEEFEFVWDVSDEIAIKPKINKKRKTTQEIDGFIPVDDGCEEFEFVWGESDVKATRPKIMSSESSEIGRWEEKVIKKTQNHTSWTDSSWEEEVGDNFDMLINKD